MGWERDERRESDRTEKDGTVVRTGGGARATITNITYIYIKGSDSGD